MIVHLLNRLVPHIMIAAALSLHASYCEWDICSGNEGVSPGQFQRAIYYQHNVIRDVFLLAKSLSEKEEAQLYGVALPLLLVVIAIGMLQLTGEARSPRHTRVGI